MSTEAASVGPYQPCFPIAGRTNDPMVNNYLNAVDIVQYDTENMYGAPPDSVFAVAGMVNTRVRNAWEIARASGIEGGFGGPGYAGEGHGSPNEEFQREYGGEDTKAGVALKEGLSAGAIAGGITAAGMAIVGGGLAAISFPVVLGVAAVAGIGYGLYKLFGGGGEGGH
jgi:hypothetical protein